MEEVRLLENSGTQGYHEHAAELSKPITKTAIDTCKEFFSGKKPRLKVLRKKTVNFSKNDSNEKDPKQLSG